MIVTIFFKVQNSNLHSVSGFGCPAGAGTAVAETVSSLGTYTVAVGTYTVTAPVAVLAAIGVMLAGVASWMAARRFRGRSAETQSLLRGSAYGAGNGDNMV